MASSLYKKDSYTTYLEELSTHVTHYNYKNDDGTIF